MLIVGLACGLLFYIWMYWIWDSASLFLGGASSPLARFDHMIFMPQGTVFVIFRGLLLITLLYVFCDFLYSTARNGYRKMKAGAACPVRYPASGARDAAAGNSSQPRR